MEVNHFKLEHFGLDYFSITHFNGSATNPWIEKQPVTGVWTEEAALVAAAEFGDDTVIISDPEEGEVVDPHASIEPEDPYWTKKADVTNTWTEEDIL